MEQDRSVSEKEAKPGNPDTSRKEEEDTKRDREIDDAEEKKNGKGYDGGARRRG